MRDRLQWMVARDVLQPDEMKFVVANTCPGWSDVSLSWLLWMSFSRWPIDRCFQQAKDELGMDHFEVRGWRSIHRHLYVTQLSHLFCARVHQDLREKNDRLRIPHGRAGSRRRLGLGGGPRLAEVSPEDDLSGSSRTDRVLSTSQPGGPQVAYESDPQTPPRNRHKSRTITLLRTGRPMTKRRCSVSRGFLSPNWRRNPPLNQGTRWESRSSERTTVIAP